jgi:hypothetical protein
VNDLVTDHRDPAVDQFLRSVLRRDGQVVEAANGRLRAQQRDIVVRQRADPADHLRMPVDGIKAHAGTVADCRRLRPIERKHRVVHWIDVCDFVQRVDVVCSQGLDIGNGDELT